VLNNGNVKGLPVLRTMQNRDKEFNPRAFRVYGPKIVAMRGAFEDPALESRFLTEEMGQRAVRSDISIPLPDALQGEALGLRNRLLHYRFCHLFDTKPDMAALLQGVEPRINQIALPLLSLVDEAEIRSDIRDRLLHEQTERSLARQDTIEAKMVAALCEVMDAADNAPLSVSAITDRFNAANTQEFGKPVSQKWVGHVLRTRLRLATQKSHGVYVVPFSQRSKIVVLAARYNAWVEPRVPGEAGPTAQNDFQHAPPSP
jgi:hypothetical protein